LTQLSSSIFSTEQTKLGNKKKTKKQTTTTTKTPQTKITKNKKPETK
jgi:hypothetical protein